MPRLRGAEQALRLFADASRQPYVCRTCRAHAIRQFHSSRPTPAELPFFKRIQQTLFGSKESKESEQKRDEQVQKQREEMAARDEQPGFKVTKGKKYTIVEPADPAVNKDYVMSSTWDGLERVGSEQYLKAKKDRGEEYVGFMPSKRVKFEDSQVAKLLHHISVEVLTLQNAGRNIDEVCATRDDDTNNLKRTGSVAITLADDNAPPSLKFKSEKDERDILRAIPRRQASTKKTPPSPPNGVKFARFQGGAHRQETDSWMDMPLRDPRVKLTLVKRMLQITGYRIPDPVISAANTLRDLHTAFKTKEKPKKLAQTEQLQQLKGAPNVAVHASRRTPIHKEKAVGRWKVIEEELIARDLPVTGSRWREAKPAIAP